MVECLPSIRKTQGSIKVSQKGKNKMWGVMVYTFYSSTGETGASKIRGQKIR